MLKYTKKKHKINNKMLQFTAYKNGKGLVSKLFLKNSNATEEYLKLLIK